MPKLYLLGGENVYLRNAKVINRTAFEDAEKPLNVLVFPWARASFDNTYRKRKLLFDYFRSLGSDNVTFIEYGESELAGKIAEANLIYLTGGQASILIERTKNMGLDKLLKNFCGVIVGRSAGALALCSRCVTTCRSNSKVRVIYGLGLVNITLKVHYTQDKDDILKSFSMREEIYAVPQSSALVCNNGRVSSIGKAYVFKNGNRYDFSARTKG